jgi:hypothetical protein
VPGVSVSPCGSATLAATIGDLRRAGVVVSDEVLGGTGTRPSHDPAGNLVKRHRVAGCSPA